MKQISADKTSILGHGKRAGDHHIGNGQVEHFASDDEFCATLSKEFNKRVEKLNDNSVDLALKTVEARKFLDWHCSSVKESWMNWLNQSEKVLENIRITRVAISHESKTLLSDCADVRKFFIGDDHEKEISRLREFIELCERLRALKQDGTLDKVADTILKLA